MKKQLRLVLFAALIMILVMMTALVASAATDGADVREEGHYYEVLSATDAATPKYYTTLAAAVGAVDADGYTITVLSNVTEPGVVLNKAFTYTITGGAEGATITFNATTTAGTSEVLFNVAAGTVTLDKLTVAYDNGVIASAPAAVVYISGVCQLTLNDFVTGAVVEDTVSINAKATVTVSGAGTSISGGTVSAINAAKNTSEDSHITVSGGQLSADRYVVVVWADIVLDVNGGTLTSVTDVAFYVRSCAPAITVSNATINSQGIFGGRKAQSAISLLEGAKLYANGGTMFDAFDATGASVILNGAELHLVGEKALLHADTAVSATITCIAGSVFVEDGAAVPAANLDNSFDWSKLSLTLLSFSGSCEITEGTHTIASLADNNALAKAPLTATYAARFPNFSVELNGWVPLHLNNAEAKLIITGGEYAVSSSYMFQITAGELEITGGKFTNEGGDIIQVLGENVTVSINLPDDDSNGMYTDGRIVYAKNATNAAVTITNGRFVEIAPDTENDQMDALFCFDNDGSATEGVTITIEDGYFEASRMLLLNNVKATATIKDGTFVSNQIVGETVEAHSENAHMISLCGGDAILVINGGSFDNKQGNFIIAQNGDGGASITINGGSFNGGEGWIYCNDYTDINIGNTYDNEGNVIATPTFSSPDETYAKYGICSDTAREGSATWNISGGSFTIKDGQNRVMFYAKGNINVKISGGEFTVTRGNRYDSDQQLQNDTMILDADGGADYLVNIDITGGTFRAARFIRYYNAGGTLNIYGGNFTSNSVSIDDSMMFQLAHDKAVFNIYGGTITGNNYIMAVIYVNGKAGSTLNILGGTITGGTRWIDVRVSVRITIDRGSYVDESGNTINTAPVFGTLSDGANADMKDGKPASYGEYGIYLTTAAMGSVVDIKYGSFVFPTTHSYPILLPYGGDVTIYPGVVMEGPNSLFHIASTFKGRLVIKGGTFTGISTSNMINFTTSASKYESNPYDSEIIIEGGTFIATESSTIFNMKSTATAYKFTIKGGTFISEETRLFYASNMGTQFVIEGGEFSTTAASMFYMARNRTPLVIKNGTFTFEDRYGINADNALIYVSGTTYLALIELQGGIFIDKRLGSNQSIFKANENAEVKFTGPFQLYVKELKDNFYYDYDDNAKSISMGSYIQTELNGEPYYQCFGYYHENAPSMTVAPTLRPVLGSEGIVYSASVSAEAAAYLASLGTVTYGTLIFPTEYMGSNGWTNDTDFLKELQAYALANGKSESTVYTIVNAVNGLVTEEDGSLTFRAALINLKENNYARSMTGIAFAKVTAADGTVTYYYASHVSAGVSGNMRSIAAVALQDINENPVENNGHVYCYAAIMTQNGFSRYPTALQDCLRKYLPEDERKPKY